MAKRTASGLKKHRQSLKRKERNNEVLSRLKTLSKKANAAMESGDAAKSEGALKTLESALDKAASKGIIHKKNASRNVARFSKRAHKLSKQKTTVEAAQPTG